MACAQSGGVSLKDVYWGSGHSCHLIDTKVRSSTPMKKLGTEYPISDRPTSNRSGQRPRLSAAMIPKSTPVMIHMTKAPMAMEAVIGSASLTMSVTHFVLTEEYPREGASQCVTSWGVFAFTSGSEG